LPCFDPKGSSYAELILLTQYLYYTQPTAFVKRFMTFFSTDLWPN
jgi:hypothetical protein